MKLKMDICYVTNDGFVEPTAVSITSLLENNKSADISINIVYCDLCEESIKKISVIAYKYKNVNFIFHKVDSSRFKPLQLTIPHITIETYFRYILPELLPNVSKVLYLDGDTIVNGDLSELFEMDISEYCCAGVRDIYVEEIEYKKDLGLCGLYINAGVILFNLEKIKNSNFTEELFSITGSKKLRFQDQDALNIVLSGRIKEIDCIYNFKRSHQKRFPKRVSSAKIIHYVGPNKPWKIFSLNKIKRLYNRYAKLYKTRKKVGLLVDEYFGAWRTAFGGYGFLAKEIIAKYLPCDDIELEVIIGKQKNNPFWASSRIIDGIKVWRLPRTEFLIRRWLAKSDCDCWLSIEMCYDFILRLDPNNNRKLLLWIQDPRPKTAWEKIQEMKKIKDFFFYDQSCCDVVKKWYNERRVKFISQGQSLSSLACELYQVKNAIPELVRNPIDIDFEYEFSISKKEKIIVFLGRLEAQKRVWIFCEIAKLMPEYNFYVIGDFYRYKEENKATVLPYMDGNIKNLHFCGRLVGKEKLDLLKRARVLVNTSVWEGIPISWLEALSYGTLIVSSLDRENLVSHFGRYVGEVNGDGDDCAGLFVEPIREFLENDSVYEQTAKSAISYIREFHNLDRFKKNIRNVIRNFCN